MCYRSQLHGNNFTHLFASNDLLFVDHIMLIPAKSGESDSIGTLEKCLLNFDLKLDFFVSFD